MQVVLNKDVPKLGYRGDTVKVKNGYFMNFLLPNGLADMATLTRLKVADSRKDKIVLEKQQLLDNAKEVLHKLHGLTLNFKLKASSKGKLFGAVVEADIIKAVKEAVSVKLEKEFVKMEHIKAIGEHTVLIHLAPDFEESVKVVVEAA